ncbi:MAG: aspartate aminotransferase family protein [Calditerrivibrio sp.]|nr:aspartate aminotransferase family protein [Calditerrivibrio sp.]
MGNVMNTYNRYDITLVKGEGAYLYDDLGNRYIDFASGIAVTNLGNSNPLISDVISKQANTLIHTSNLYRNPIQEETADLISKLSFGGSVFFCNSGAEANEAALKLSRIYGNKKYAGKKFKVITMNNSFHGRTFATLSATGQEKVKKGFEPTLNFIKHIPYNDINIFKDSIEDETVAVMLEVIQGEGGVVPADESYIHEIRKICTERDILLIFDEVQTGIGRTGKMFGYQHYGVEPDAMTLAKALGNGFPIGAMTAKKDIAEYLSPGTHATTFGGNYLGCAIAKKVLSIISEKSFLDSVNEKSVYLVEKLRNILNGYGIIRGKGLMLGVRLNDNINASDFIKNAHKNRILTVPAGDNTIRIYPPLNIDFDTLDEGIKLLKKSLEDTI